MVNGKDISTFTDEEEKEAELEDVVLFLFQKDSFSCSSKPISEEFMQEKLTIKKVLYKRCMQDLERRLDIIENQLMLIKEARDNETKNSAGDKYETGRAMMQMEEEKNRRQLSEVNLSRQKLLQLNPEKTAEKVEPGSLVTTNKGIYYISIGLGKLQMGNQLYYCISIDSPIGQLMSNKREGAELSFNGNEFRIISIS